MVCMCVYECVREEVLLKFKIQKNSQRRELFGGVGIGLPGSTLYFCLQNHSFQRAIIYLLESPKTFSSGPSGWSSPNSSQRKIACQICTEHREFIMRTKSKDISLGVTKERINLEFSWLLSTTSPKCCFVHCFNIYFIIKLEFKK